MIASQPNLLTAQLAIAEPVISRHVRNVLRRFQSADRDDAAQNVRLRLVTTILHRFDPSRGSIEAFIYSAVRSAVCDERRRLIAEKKRAAWPLEDEDEVYSPGAGAEQLIHDLIEEPSNYLSAIKAKLLQAVLATASRNELANHLGCSRAACDNRVSRLMADVAQLAN